ncbi:MAG: hypothetical protein IKB80_06810 [Oscillospiraceae bacterium]|nr:hypothetical protein [Oscillospiraceae bacterium]
MKRSVSTWQMGGFVFTGVLGTLLHFLFDWTGGSGVAALFSAVNESIWEHMKLLYYPMLAFAFIEYSKWGKDCPQFWCVKLVGMLVGLVVIPVIYYTYTGILGVSADWFNIAIFFLAAGMAFYLETKLFEKQHAYCISPDKAFVLFCLLGVAFTVLTFATPQIPFFQDPLTGTYGFQK